MKISLETDYAIRIVQCLSNCGCRVDAASISKKTGVSQRFALKILRKLVSAGLVKSFKGVGGGYILNRAPEAITLREVIETVEGPLVISRCQLADYQCDRPEDCACYFRQVFESVAKDMAEKFEKINFAPQK